MRASSNIGLRSSQPHEFQIFPIYLCVSAPLRENSLFLSETKP
jgi:hypothetical protein